MVGNLCSLVLAALFPGFQSAWLFPWISSAVITGQKKKKMKMKKESTKPKNKMCVCRYVRERLCARARAQ